MTFSCIGISRHRIGRDGVGVTTLVGGHGCPLDCEYCLNPTCKSGKTPFVYDVFELYEKVRCDSLYFLATNGGIVFGGGEPLLQAEFIREFILYTREIGEGWRFTLESCLAVPLDKLTMLDGLIDEYIVDIKDMNAEIYQGYTKRHQEPMRAALGHLSAASDKVLVRVPLIPGYNTRADVERSLEELRAMGFEKFDVFEYKILDKKQIL